MSKRSPATTRPSWRARISRDAYFNRGNALQDLGEHETAVASYDRAIALQPSHAMAWCERGKALAALTQAEEAIVSFDRAISLRTGPPRRRTATAGWPLQYLRRHEEAIESYRKATAHPSRSRRGALESRSLSHLALGQYEIGWALFEWRWKAGLARPGHSIAGDLLVRRFSNRGQNNSGVRRARLWRFATVLPLRADARRTRQGRAGCAASAGAVALRIEGHGPGGRDGRCGAAGGRVGSDDEPASGVPATRWRPFRRRSRICALIRNVPAAWRKRLAGLPGRKIGLVWAGSPRPGDREFQPDRSEAIHYAAAFFFVCRHAWDFSYFVAER